MGLNPGVAAQDRAVGRLEGRANTTYPWHIHGGACGGKGQIAGKPQAYPVLKTGADGSASLSTTLPTPAPTAGEYSVTVHKSSKDMTPIACGDLKADSLATPAMPMPMAKDTSMTPKHTTTRP